MDEVDEKILKILEKDSRTSFTEIGRKIGRSEAAVRRRINRLSTSGVIKQFTIKTSRSGSWGLVWVSVINPQPVAEVAKSIVGLENVEIAFEVTGEYDIAVIIKGNDIARLNDCIDRIRKTQFVQNTATVIILKTWEKPPEES